LGGGGRRVKELEASLGDIVRAYLKKKKKKERERDRQTKNKLLWGKNRQKRVSKSEKLSHRN
jgi:hypothetical protein